jgi:adenine-specific DNA-methyltransferase
VHFRLVEATAEAGNAKEPDESKRRYILAQEDSILVDDSTQTLTLHFEFRTPCAADTNRIEEATRIFGGNYDKNSGRTKGDEREAFCADAEICALKEISDEWKNSLATLAPTVAKPRRTILGKHLDHFTARNSFDYFIHMGLGRFLNRELDFYVKNEVLRLDDFDSLSFDVMNRFHGKVKAIRKVASRIIQFLASIEDFQKRLFEKKKFVLESHLCMRLSAIPSDLLTEVFGCEKQLNEWKAEGLEIAKDSFLSLEFASQEVKNAIVDTRNFSTHFKDRLRSVIQNAYEGLSGLCCGGDNGDLLRLIDKWVPKFDFSYIDPPYNTGSDFFLYKDEFRHSTWLAMIADRLKRIFDLTSETGVVFCSIDDNEAWRLLSLRSSLCKFTKAPPLYVQVRYAGKTLTEDMDFQKLIEQVAIISKPGFQPIKPSQEYSFDKFVYRIRELSSGKHIQLDNRDCIVFEPSEFEIESIPPSREGLKEVWATGSILEKNSSGRFFRDFLAGREKVDGLGCLYKVPNIGDDGLPYRYFTGPKRSSATKGKYYQGVPNGKEEGDESLGVIPNFYDFADSFGNCRHEGGVEFRSGKKPEIFISTLLDMSVTKEALAWTLEPFAGSASGSAVSLKLGYRWVAAEAGQYFYDKTLRRMKNALSGHPTGVAVSPRSERLYYFNYFCLESYADALNNLPSPDGKLFEAIDQSTRDSLITYSLDLELGPHLLNMDAFKDPWGYKIYAQLAGEDEVSLHNVDMVETLNYLLGLRVQTYGPIERYSAEFVRLPHGDDKDSKGNPLPDDKREGRLRVEGRLRRDAEGPYVYQRIEGELNDGNATRVLVIWRKLTDDAEKDAAVLEAWMARHRESTKERSDYREYHLIYLNGPITLPQPTQELRTVLPTEQTFKDRMFEDTEV